MFPRVENGKDNDLKESTGRGGKCRHFVVERCHRVLRGSPIDIQILQRENDSAAANICTFTFMKHPKDEKRVCSS